MPIGGTAVHGRGLVGDWIDRIGRNGGTKIKINNGHGQILFVGSVRGSGEKKRILNSYAELNFFKVKEQPTEAQDAIFGFRQVSAENKKY